MFKSLIAGAAALGLIVTATPQRAEAGDNDVLRGVIAGAIILGTIAALDNAYDDRGSRHKHSHNHVRSKPGYGHSSHNVYRHGTRIYSGRDTRYGHSDRRYDDYRRDGHRNRGNDVRRNSDYHSHGDYRHKNHGGHKNANRNANRNDGKKHAGDGRRNGNGKQVQRLQAQKERLIHNNARLRRQLERRDLYVQNHRLTRQ